MQTNNNQHQGQLRENQSPNLAQSPYTPEKLHRLKLALRLNQIFLLMFEFVAILILLFNLKLIKEIKSLDTTIGEVHSLIKQDSEVERSARILNLKTLGFEEVKKANSKMQDKISLIYNATPKEISILGLELFSNTLNLKLESPSAIELAKFVNAYMETKYVEEIALNGASLNPSDNSYSFDLQVTTKGGL